VPLTDLGQRSDNILLKWFYKKKLKGKFVGEVQRDGGTLDLLGGQGNVEK
jgi:hypothetical protein